MNELQLSKSKYCRAKQCNKILWMDKNMPEEKVSTARESVLSNGIRVGELAKSLFGTYTNIKYNKDLSIMIDETKIALEKKPNVICEASFKFENNFCSVDILKNNEDGLEIYEVKSSAGIKDIYLDDVSYQYFVLLKLGYKIKKVNLVYINTKYVRHGELELDKLFCIEDVTEIAKNKFKEIETIINNLDKFMEENKEEPEKQIGKYCLKPYVCDYWDYCTRNIPENNVFKIKGMHLDKKFKYYYEGKESLEDIQYEDINPKYLEQIDYEINDKEDKIEKDKIREFLDTLSYPIYFLDFETYQPAIPEYDGIHPYMQIPFQYSLHYIEKEGGELKHKEFLAESGCDPRRKLAQRLVEDIPQNVCVTAYNMGFEKMVIKDLAGLFPDLSEHLLNIRENIKDLIIPFRSRMYYNKKMEGYYTIKYVLPALFPDDPELDYHNLPVVHNGAEASAVFENLAYQSMEEQIEIREGLLKYCKLDTYAMVKVWEKLKEACKE